MKGKEIIQKSVENDARQVESEALSLKHKILLAKAACWILGAGSFGLFLERLAFDQTVVLRHLLYTLLGCACAVGFARLDRRIHFVLDRARVFVGTNHAPPKHSEFLLYLILPWDHREAVAGDLAEEYATIILPKFGRRGADWWFRCQVARSIWPLLWPRLRKAVFWIAGLKFAQDLLKRIGLG